MTAPAEAATRAPGEAPVAVGVDVGGTKVLGVALGPGGSLLGEARVATPAQLARAGTVQGPDAGHALGDAVASVVGALAAGGRPPVGVGIAGMVRRDGVLVFSPNLPGGTGLDVGGSVGRRLGAPVVVDNDATCAAVAEHALGAARGVQHCLVVTLGTGIGGGLVATGAVQRGSQGFAGEIGHMVVDPTGPPCPCGGRGCWERFASGAGLSRLAREAAYAGNLPGALAMVGGDPESVRGEHVSAAALQGDPGALAVLAELGGWVALGLANLVAILDPQRIVLGGGLLGAGELLLTPVRAAFGRLVEGASRRAEVDIVPAALGEQAGAVGAALLAASPRR